MLARLSLTITRFTYLHGPQSPSHSHGIIFPSRKFGIEIVNPVINPEIERLAKKNNVNGANHKKIRA
jgi:hypothetical protein